MGVCSHVALRIKHAMARAILSSVACPALQFFSPTLFYKGHDFREKNTKKCVC
jgi:hypothetical protein